MNIQFLAARSALKLQKHAPEILTGLGIVGGIASTVLTARATLKAAPVYKDSKEYIAIVREQKAELGDQYGRTLGIVYAKSALDVGKIYAVPLAVGALSITSILVGHSILHKRHAAAVATVTALTQAFDKYREKVAEVIGAEEEAALRYGADGWTTEEDKETGERITKLEGIDPNDISIYAKFFDEGAGEWTRDPDYNRFFLQSQQRYMNQRLAAKGHVFLNEVYDALGLPRTKAGQCVGWVYDESRGDGFIDFGVFKANSERARRFVNGDEGSILLDFNVDGVILDLI